MKIIKLINNLSRKKTLLVVASCRHIIRKILKKNFLNQNLSVNAIQTRLVIIKKTTNICLFMSIKYKINFIFLVLLICRF